MKRNWGELHSRVILLYWGTVAQNEAPLDADLGEKSPVCGSVFDA